MSSSTATAAAPVHPAIISKGGLESTTAAILAMSYRAGVSCLIDAAGCLDATESIPAGGMFAFEVSGEHRTAQRFTLRGSL